MSCWVIQLPNSLSHPGPQEIRYGRWFSQGTPASSTTKTGRHDIAEILLTVALNTITLTPQIHVLSGQDSRLIDPLTYYHFFLFYNISAISWRPVLVVEEAGVP
jgi:hypothetical protein